MIEFGSLDIRPYQLLCCICRAGAEAGEKYYFAERLDEIAAAVRAQPSLPLTLRCTVNSAYSYQNPGRAYDTPEGDLFNDKRDLDILHLLGLAPGDTRPAWDLFNGVFAVISTCTGICGYAEVTSETWQGCRLARSGNYERGHARGAEAIIPLREASEKARVKDASAAAMYEARALRVRPHHLMCMTCFHGGRDALEPIAEDNLFEAIDACRRDPQMPITLVSGPCDICPPCSDYDAQRNWCAGRIGMALRDEKKDLDLLQLLGLKYGDTLPARELLQRLYDMVCSTRQICGYGDGVVRSTEWSICRGPEGSPEYVKGRAAGLGVNGVAVDRDEGTSDRS
ncbi:MAG: hypothetical protein JSV65_09780 [Armatimonadota bacterium]|nr:MAG: hypothetical protein JSV65_09780 [Armatimonadota bacterium]